MARTIDSDSGAFFEANAKLESIIKMDGNAIEIAEAPLLFSAEFERDGPDLLLVNDGHQTVRVIDYFRVASPPDLVSTEGSVLKGELVEILAGPAFAGQTAQAAGQAVGAGAIGQVESLSGTAFVQRANGTTEQLSLKTKVFQNDVIRTEGDSTVSVTFVDGTIFTLAAASRMVLSELIYDPASNNNSGVFNLVEGTFVFIAGQVAKTGGMEVSTPAATMGIRGTTVLVDIKTVAGITTVSVTLNRDPDGEVGQFQITGLDGNLIANVTGTDTKWIVSPVEGETREVPRTVDDLNSDQVIITRAFAAFSDATGRVNSGGEYVEGRNGQQQQQNDDPPQLPPDPQQNQDPQNPEQRGDLGSSGFGTEIASDRLPAGQLNNGVGISALGGEGLDAVGASGSQGGGGDRGPQGPPPQNNPQGSNGEQEIAADEVIEEETGSSAPTIQLTGGDFTVPEDGAVVLSGFNIVDPDGSTLTATLVAGSTVTLQPGSGVVILDGTGTNDERIVIQGTAEQLNAALNGIIYNPSPNADDEGTLSIAVTDGTNSAAVVMVIQIMPGQDAPIAVIDTAVRNENDNLLVGNLLENDSDPDISPVPDVLEVVEARQGANSTGPIASGGFGTLTLEGGGSLIVFSNGTYSFEPGTAYDALRTGESLTENITYVLTDNAIDPATGQLQIVESSLQIVINGSNDVLVVGGEGSVTVLEDETAVISQIDLTATDPDTADSDVIFTITAAPEHGQLELTTAPGAAITTFTKADIVAGRVVYAHNGDAATADGFSFNVNDGGGSVSGTFAIAITSVNDDPGATGIPTLVTVLEDTVEDIDLSSITLSDSDANGAQITLTLSATTGTLTAATTASVTAVAIGGTVTLEGTVDALNTYLDTITNIQYVGVANVFGTTADTITVTANDGGNSGIGGGDDVELGTINVNIDGVDDPSEIETSAGVRDIDENATGEFVDANLSISDIDSETLTSATVTISSGYEIGEDVLSAPGVDFLTNFDAATGVLTISGVASVVAYQGALRSVVYENTSDDPSATPRTLSFQVFDGASGSNVATRDVTVNPINDDPTVGNIPGSFSLTEDVATALNFGTVSSSGFSALAVGDADSGSNVIQLILQVTNGTLTDNVGSSLVTGSGTNTLTFNGTIEDIDLYFVELQDIIYTPVADANGSPADSLVITINDFGSSGAGGGSVITAGTIDINITAVDDAPEVATSTGATNYVEAAGGVIVDGLISVSDIDSPQLVGATVTISSEFEVGFDSLLFTPTGSITGSFSSATGVLSLSGPGTLAEYETVLKSVTFINSSTAPSTNPREVSFSVNDGNMVSTIATKTINVTDVENPPVLSFSYGASNFTENGSPAFLDLTATITDADSANLQSATVQISGNFVSTEDVLGFTNVGGITGDYVAATGTLTFTGIGTLAEYKTALESVTYSNTSENPSTSPRELTFQVSDGVLTSNAETIDVGVIAVNDDPVRTSLPSTIAAIEDTTTQIDLSEIQIEDVDAGGADIQIMLSVQGGGSLSLASSTIVTVSGGTVTGTVAEINAYLDGNNFQYTPPADASGIDPSRRLVLQTNDLGNTGTGGGTTSSTFINFDIAAVNDAPTITGVPTSLTVIEDTLGELDLNGVTIADIDANGADVVLTITPGSGVLTLAPSAGLTIIGNTITGSVSDINAYLNTGGSVSSNVSYTPDLHVTGSETLQFTVSDLGNTGSGGVQTDTVNVFVGITAVNDDPFATGFTGGILNNAFVEDTSGALALSAISLFDVDAGSNDLLLTFDATGGALTATTGGGVIVTQVSADVVTLEGTLSELNAFITGPNVIYTPPADVNGTAADSIVIKLNDQGNSGPGGGTDITLGAVEIDISAVNDAPVTDAGALASGVSGDQETNIDISGVSITDVDAAPAAIVRLTISAADSNGTFTVNSAVTSGVTAGQITNNGTGVVVIDATLAQINTTLAATGGVFYTGNTSFNGTEDITFVVSDLGNSGAGGALSDTVTITATVNATGAPAAGTSLVDVTAPATSAFDGIQFSGDGGIADSDAGRVVSNIGDINNDGLDDFAIGAPDNQGDGASLPALAGSTYILFGQADNATFRGLADGTGRLDLDTAIQGGRGFELVSASAGDRLGVEVSGGGDINGDGIDDFVVGAPFDNNPMAGSSINPGAAYVIYGGQNFLDFDSAQGEIDVDTIGDPSQLQGFQLQGTQNNGNLGQSISIAGDFNHDGIDDLLVGSPTQTGAVGNTYLIFGGQDFETFTAGYTVTVGAVAGDIFINPDLPSGLQGFRLVGENVPDLAGYSVDFINDLNGDGVDDLVIGSLQNSNGGAGSTFGKAHIIYGGQDLSPFTGVADDDINLSTVGAAGPAGFQLVGEAIGDGAGLVVGSAGDFNNDGIADLIVTSQANSDPLATQGATYIVFGGQTLTGNLALADVGDTGASATISGIKFRGEAVGDRANQASRAGDVNGDGIEDLIIGASWADAPGNNTGAAYVVYGGQSGLVGDIDLDNIGGSLAGFKITGEAAGNFAASSVSAAGDVNGDGFDDILVGAPSNADGGLGAGAGYLVYGGNFTGVTVDLGTNGVESRSGGTGAETFILLDGNDTAFGNGGDDVFYGGDGNDKFFAATVVQDTSVVGFQHVDGGLGQDTLDLQGVRNVMVSGPAQGSVDLTNVSNDAITGIEEISLFAGANVTLTLGADDVFDMTDEGNAALRALLGTNGNTIEIEGDSMDTVNLSNDTTGAWTLNATLTTVATAQALNVFTFSATGSSDVLATVAIDNVVDYNIVA